mmetsp:Transcript_40385/g.108388  ORF Transcript_40385/g.108388 Transcript_40385/m.108388 type:complete len:164 (-) Transcript_40385:654-1145(-)
MHAQIDDELKVVRYEPYSVEDWVQFHDGCDDDDEQTRAELGGGTFATTYRMSVTLSGLGAMVAAKKFDLRRLRKDGIELKHLRGEAELLSSLCHPNVGVGGWADPVPGCCMHGARVLARHGICWWRLPEAPHSHRRHGRSGSAHPQAALVRPSVLAPSEGHSP